MSLAEVENMTTLQLFTVGGSGGMLTQEILGVLRCILRDTENHAELLEKRLIIIACCELLKHWKPSPLARVSIVYISFICLYHSTGIHAQASAVLRWVGLACDYSEQ